MLRGHKQIFPTLKSHIDPSAHYIWIHAASLGEFEQGRPIIERIKEQYPQYPILLTFFSPSGYEVRKNYPLADIVCYLPFDTPKNVTRFLDSVNLRAAVFIKYEFWYNYLTELHRRKIPTFIVSATFRPSQLFFRWYGFKARKVLSYYENICVQDTLSAQLLSSIHIHQVTVCGDTRFDRVATIAHNTKDIPAVTRFVDAPTTKPLVLVAGSTWHKDEMMLSYFFNNHPHVKLIIAPHEISETHLQQIEKTFTRPSIRLSRIDDATEIHRYDCLIIDSFGLLANIYRYADIAYVGGGFGAGIHNILEAAVYNIPVLFGPNYHKFLEAVSLLSEGGAISVSSSEELYRVLKSLSQDKQQIQTIGAKAGKYVACHTGALDRVMKCLNL